MANVMQKKQIVLKGQKFDSESGIFEGYASVFGNVDSDGDIVEQGAFAKFLADDWSRVKILALHNDQWLPIGKPVELYEDDVGLYIKVKISQTTLGADVLQLLKDGVLDEMSIGYIVLDSCMDGGVRHLMELALIEVSVVTWAANEQAKVLDVKSKAIKGTSPDVLIKIAETLEQQAAQLRAEAALVPEESDHTKSSTPKAVTLPARLVGSAQKRRVK